MGASSSTDNPSSQELQEEESTASSTGSISFLRYAFANLSSPSESDSVPFSSLTQTFSLNPNPKSNLSPPSFPTLLSHLAPSLTSLLFAPPETETQTDWLHFLKGYNKCCARMTASSSLALLFRLYLHTCTRAEIACGLEFDEETEKVGGVLTATDLTMLFLMCWMMERSWRVSGGGAVALPDLRHLVVSALVSSGEIGDGDERVWEGDVLRVEIGVPAQKVNAWVLSNAPGIVNCLSRFVQEKMRACAAASSGDSIISAGDSYSGDVKNAFLLTCGRAWAISLALRNTLAEELSRASFPELANDALDYILYSSTIHGRGLSRFWSSIEGYHGPLLIIISACSLDTNQSENSARRWMIGILTDQGFENKETFYGNSGYLYAISPIFNVFSPSGTEKNFMYSHLHRTGYEPKPKPVGLAFGGTLGNERIFIDEDFARVTVRHHAVDKTYQHGSLIPNQGFLPVESTLLEAEVWGFGGKASKEQQDAYKKRETLFSDQRRKIDLKTFGNWEESPEKMMMDMVSDPNRVQREDR